MRTLKKFDKSVFDLKYCPADANVAVINRDGSISFGTHQDAKPFYPNYWSDGMWDNVS